MPTVPNFLRICALWLFAHRWPERILSAAAICFVCAVTLAQDSLHLVVMDPLSSQLACDCVKGYAQRDYRRLADYLQKRLKRAVSVTFAEDLLQVARGNEPRPVDLVIGKDSVVRADAAQGKLKVRPLVALTGLDGETTLRGLFVVCRSDRAQQIKDLVGYPIFLGPAEAMEKHGAAIAALLAAGVRVPSTILVRPSCADAALATIETDRPSAAVISSYAVPLLEGCGTVERGALRVIGKTEPVPFITVFATDHIREDMAQQTKRSLLAVRDDPELAAALESKHGFVEIDAVRPRRDSSQQPAAPVPPPGEFGDTVLPGVEASPTKVRDEAGATGPAEWPGWRGPARDNLSPWLPDRLPSRPTMVWCHRLSGSCPAGVAATGKRVIVGDKDAADEYDVWRCLDAGTGQQLWQFAYRAVGQMDYGNGPRATPLIHQGRVYLLSALGDLHCVSLDAGKLLWKQNVLITFNGKLPTWGICGSPLLVDGRLIVGGGGLEGSVVALDPSSGKTLWQGEGRWTAYASPVTGSFGGMQQIITYDADTLGGWDAATGERLWRLTPAEPGDFNVPTPVPLGNRLLISSENNGTRLHAFGDWGVILPRPVAKHAELAPDSTTPVVVGGRVYGCSNRLYCLDVSQGLKELWAAEDPAFEHYATIIGSPTRLLITSSRGELLLVAAGEPSYRLISRLQLFGEDSEVLAQPALVGSRLYVRSDLAVGCLELDQGGANAAQNGDATRTAQ